MELMRKPNSISLVALGIATICEAFASRNSLIYSKGSVDF
jgi:hypothetical protein